MAISAVALVRLRNLFAVVMFSGIYSLLAAVLYVVMDAVDVAFTEAAVGAGIATVLMLGTLTLTTEKSEQSHKLSLSSLAVVTITGAALVYATLDMPRYGEVTAPIHHHVAPRYIEKSGKEVGMPNIVTSVLASYRGFDTLGEVTVIFTAAIGVMALIGRRREKKKKPEPKKKKAPSKNTKKAEA
jgi:multicomponent Na+:H+ antiporter subunit B